MEDRSSNSKPAPSPSQSSTTDIKSPTTRPTYSSKLGDQKTRSSEPSTTNQTARPPIQRAWTSNKNPITGRSQPPQNNFGSQNKQLATSSLREGQRVRITLATGAEFEGTYSNGPDPTSCRLNMVQQKKLPNSAEIANGANRRDQPTMSFQKKEIVEARVLSGNAGKADGKNLNGNRSSFRTDGAISDARSGPNRELKRWLPDSNDGASAPQDVSMSLEKSSGSGWDQFAENERLFGLKSDYDENIYTTMIDKSHPQYRERMAAADKKAREIERSAAMSSHVAEERVMDFAGGGDGQDEEDKYSGVRRQPQQQDFPPLSSRDNKYTPPARRAPTGQATVKGAPVDPAIISSQLKAPTPKPPISKSEELKTTTQHNKSAAEAKPAEPKLEVKSTESKETRESESSTEKASDAKPGDKSATPVRPSAATSRTATPKEVVAAASATLTVERDVLNSFKSFATQQRLVAEKARSVKIKQDKEVKLTELKNFASNFKLSTPVPKDLIGIIAKDPVKQKAIQEKALQNAEDIAKQRAAEAAQKEKEAAAAKENQAKAAPEQPAAAAAAPAADTRNSARPSAPQHANSPAGVSGRHPGPRSSYNAQPYHQQYGRNNRPAPHMGAQGQQTGNLGQRLRNLDQQKMQHMSSPHAGVPTGPANSTDPSFARRVSGLQAGFMANKLNPNSHEFRPSAFAPAFMPAGPSQGSSPRSSVNNVVEAAIPPTPVPGQLIRRKTKAVDVKKCLILSHIQSIQPPTQHGNWDHNDGLQPPWDTIPTWRQLKVDSEDPASSMFLTYKDALEKLARLNAQVATPNPSHVMPQLPPHQHQLPLHLQHGAQNLAPRQSPHPPPMQMHAGQHVHAPHVPFSNPDDHRMMHSNSAQSFASPRMGQVPMAYPPNMSTPGQIPFSQPVMQHYIQPGAPQMGQFRSFSNNPQFIPQQPHGMGSPMMTQPQYMTSPNGMVATGPHVGMYPGHPAYMAPATLPQQPIPGSNGFPSPSRPVAPMMAHQGSHQGQPAVYGMSPGMPYQQPVYPPQQTQGKFTGQRPQ